MHDHAAREKRPLEPQAMRVAGLGGRNAYADRTRFRLIRRRQPRLRVDIHFACCQAGPWRAMLNFEVLARERISVVMTWGWYHDWRRRHRHPMSFILHVVAIPMLPLAGALAIWQLALGQWNLWYRPVALLVLSYLLQWIGHRIEGNEMGEVVWMKMRLGRPYVAISPRYAERLPATQGSTSNDRPASDRAEV